MTTTAIVAKCIFFCFGLVPVKFLVDWLEKRKGRDITDGHKKEKA